MKIELVEWRGACAESALTSSQTWIKMWHGIMFCYCRILNDKQVQRVTYIYQILWHAWFCIWSGTKNTRHCWVAAESSGRKTRWFGRYETRNKNSTWNVRIYLFYFCNSWSLIWNTKCVWMGSFVPIFGNKIINSHRGALTPGISCFYIRVRAIKMQSQWL